MSASASRITRAADPGAPAGRPGFDPVASTSASPADPILLTRSYQIPKDDPDYQRLLNWSWTYDSAVTAAAFVSLGERAQAEQLLDQLKALQFDDGSIDIAFNVVTGQGAGVFRSGNAAWMGLAGVTYNLRFGNSRYRNMARRSADFLLGLQGPTGLIRGGPGIAWSSTLHNLIAYTFFRRMAVEDPANRATYQAAADRIASGIENDLLVNDGSGLRFLEGLNDTIEPLDVQALGAIYLWGRSRFSSATEVLGRVPARFGVSGMKIALSANPETYNQTWSSPSTFSGFKPYNTTKIPNVAWFEGAAQVRAATAATGGSVTALDAESKKWRDVTASGASAAPLQANASVTSTRREFDIEYHVWPAAAAAAWWLLASNEPRFLIP